MTWWHYTNTTLSILVIKSKIFDTLLCIYSYIMCQKDADEMENSADPNQTALKEQSDLDLHCLLRPICLTT